MTGRPSQAPTRPSLLKRLRADRRGVAAIEFAFIAPVMIVLYVGLAELCTALMTDRHTSHANSAIGDLAAQTDKLYDGDIANIWAVATTLLSPYDSTPLQLRLTSVTLDASSVPKVDWSDVKSATQPDLTPLDCKATVVLPPDIAASPGDNVIMAEAVYHYTSVVAFGAKKDFKFAPRYFMRPRTVTKVARYIGGNNSTVPKCS